MTSFQHQHAAHCETGVMSTLLKNSGLELSEAMSLGLSSSIAFAFLPFVKLNGLPLIAYRMPPRSIIKGLKKQLALGVEFKKYSNPQTAMDDLDRRLDLGQILGLQTSVYWLPYFPEDMRFHFNAHNLVVYGKEGNNYLISDPIFETCVVCPREDLMKARFAKGTLAPKGMLYRLTDVPNKIDYEKVIKASIKKSVKTLTPPVPLIGIKGIHFLANRIAKLSKKIKNDKKRFLYLGHIIRMQEEIGTGGGGFRYIYASFLQEAATMLENDYLSQASEMMTDVGDEWRNFALQTVKMCKGRAEYNEQILSELLHFCAVEEAKVWAHLKNIKL